MSFQLWIGIAKRIIFAVDYWRGGSSNPALPPRHLCTIPSEGRRLTGRLVAASGSPQIAAVLLFHGIGDRIEYWADAQQHLAAHGIGSLIFHYSGYAGSTGTTTPENLHQDAHSAYAYLRERTAEGTPIFLLGFSLGSGIAAEVAPSLVPPPAGLILAQAFPSFRQAASEVVRPLRFLRYLLPDLWTTPVHLQAFGPPVLIVHSDGDRLFPLSMAHQLHASGNRPDKHLSIPSGHPHNAIYQSVPPDYWQPILDFIRRYSSGAGVV